MIATLTLPRLGETMESGRVAGWLKQPGDAFRRGETIVEIESDKTVVELPALADGTMVELLVPEGSDVEVGAPLCRYEAAGEPAMAEAPAASRAPAAAAPVAEAPVVDHPSPPVRSGERPRATPVARRLARHAGVDLTGLHGTGRRGRIEAADIRALGTAGAAAVGSVTVKRWAAAGKARGAALLLHGFGGDAQTWAALAPHLTRRGLSLAAPDLPGHGATAADAETIAELASPLAGLLDETGRVELIGHSLGGAVAVALARLHPERVARLTLIAPAGVGEAIDSDFVHGLASVQSAGGLAHLLRRLSPRPAPLSPAQLNEMAQSLASGRLAALAQAVAGGGRQQIDIVADLEALAMPVRVVWGLADEIIPWTQVARLPTRVAIHLVAGAGHVPHWDAPQAVAALFDEGQAVS